MSPYLTRVRRRAGMAGVFALVFAATVYWASRPEQAPALATDNSAGIRVLSSQAPRPSSQHGNSMAGASASATAVPEAPADTEEAAVAQYVAEKYQFLLDDLGYLSAAQRSELDRVLLAREKVAGEPAPELEARLRTLLRPGDYATYETLRESDIELYKLNDYAGGVSNVAPLSSEDREAILKTKLAYKERYRRLLADSGLHRNDASPAERQYAFAVTSRALREYLAGYLQEVRQYLANDEQFALLSGYEHTEFETELAKLRALVDLPAQGGS